jgi:hypothetical protein
MRFIIEVDHEEGEIIRKAILDNQNIWLSSENPDTENTFEFEVYPEEN